MSSRIAETLLSGAHAARSAEPAARSSERREPFGPVLNQALASGGRTPPTRRSAIDDAQTATVNDGADDHDAEAGDLDEVQPEAADAAADGAEFDDLPDDRDDDAVEISVEAAAAGVAAINAAEAAAESVVLLGQAEDGAAAPVDAAVATPTPEEAPPETEASLPKGQAGRLREFHDVLPSNGEHRIDGKVAVGIESEPDANGVDPVKVEAAIESPIEGEEQAASPTEANIALPIETAVGEEATDESGAPNSDAAPEEASESTEVENNLAPRHPGDSLPADADETAIAGTPETEATALEQSTSADSQRDPSNPSAEAAGPAPMASGDAPAAASAPRDAVRQSADRAIQAPLATGVDYGDKVDQARFVGRVEGAIRAAGARDGRIQVRLSPPELGALRIELNMHQGVMTAHIEAETTAARNLLLDNLPALRDRLAQQDVRVDRFDVDVRRDGGGSSQQQMHDRPCAQGDERRFAERRDAPQARPAPKPLSVASSVARGTTNGALDVSV